MSRLYLLSVLVLAFVSFSAVSYAQDSTKKMIEESGETTVIERTGERLVLKGTAVVTDTVQSINKEERLVVLADAEGNVLVVEAGPEVKNFDQIAIGDKVITKYYESVALQIAPPDAEPMKTDNINVIVEPEGDKPGKIDIDIISEIVEVVGVARQYNILKYKAAGEQVAKLKVDPSVSDLSKLKPGDKILVTRTEAVAVSVEKP